MLILSGFLIFLSINQNDAVRNVFAIVKDEQVVEQTPGGVSGKPK